MDTRHHIIDYSRANLRTPPAWDVNMANYPIADWTADIRLREQSTDLPPHQQGLAIALELSGPQWELAAKIPQAALANGAWHEFADGQGYIWRSGVDLLLYGLSQPYEQSGIASAAKGDGKQMGDYACAHCLRKFAREPVDLHPYPAACG